MVGVLRWFNVALRGILEAGMVFALAYWGFKSGASTLGKFLRGCAAPLLAFGIWGLVDFRRAGQLAEALRLIEELILSLLAAVALFAVRATAAGWGLVAVSIVHHLLVYACGDRLLKERA